MSFHPAPLLGFVLCLAQLGWPAACAAEESEGSQPERGKTMKGSRSWCSGWEQKGSELGVKGEILVGSVGEMKTVGGVEWHLSQEWLGFLSE